MVESHDPRSLATAPPYSVLMAGSRLACQMDVRQRGVDIVAVEALVWPDSCLDPSVADGQCVERRTAGYRFALEHGGRRYAAHIDDDGERVLVAPGK